MPRQSSRYPRFLKELREHGLMALAAEAAGLHMPTVQERLDNDHEFASACAQAQRVVQERLIRAAQEQAMQGDARLLVHLLRHHAVTTAPHHRPGMPPVQIIIQGEEHGSSD